MSEPVLYHRRACGVHRPDYSCCASAELVQHRLSRAQHKHRTYLDMAVIASRLSTCLSGDVGAVLVDSRGAVISVGVNGVPTGVAHCTEVGCVPAGDVKCIRTLHAEDNALTWARRDIEGSTLYVSRRPCYRCTAKAVNLRVSHIYWPLYPERELDPMTLALVQQAGLIVQAINTSEYL